MFACLQRLLPVTFDNPGDSAAGDVTLVRDLAASAAQPQGTRPTLSVARATTHPAPLRNVEVRFADDAQVPFPFRGRTVRTGVPAAPRLRLDDGERVLAFDDEGPLWTVSLRAAAHFRSALPIPPVGVNSNFADLFGAARVLDVLPLLHFLHEAGAFPYRNPPLRAAFMIDDPNLHWPRYGFVDYREIAAHARRDNYHVAFATIPLDTWFTHGPTAQLMLENQRWLSLLAHGNNHARHELALDRGDAANRALLHQALQRIERLEHKTGLDVCRVMVPPHGACSAATLAELPRCGFESACISAGSLRAHNPGQPWVRDLGFAPSEIIEGCPVLPRWALGGAAQAALLVAAYLGQPLIVRGHHDDLRHGVAVLDDLARYINGLGDVAWCDLRAISRSNYQWRTAGSTCVVRPLGTTVAFPIPSDATRLAVDPSSYGGEARWRMEPASNGIVLVKRRATDSETSPPATARATASVLVARRLLTEVRDRLSSPWLKA